MTTLDSLINYVFDGRKTALYHEFEDWARDSRRFRAFATRYRDKIRSKLRNVRDQGGMGDLSAELETAALLLHEERFTVEYETYAALRQRGPDFTITWKTHTPFNVEVRRVRRAELVDQGAESRSSKLMAVLSEKVGQMPPSIVNLLWLSSEAGLSEADLSQATSTLRELAERRVEEYFTRRGLVGSADFVKQYRRLSGIVLRQSGGTAIWLNPLARHPAPPEIVRAIQHL